MEYKGKPISDSRVRRVPRAVVPIPTLERLRAQDKRADELYAVLVEAAKWLYRYTPEALKEKLRRQGVIVD